MCGSQSEAPPEALHSRRRHFSFRLWVGRWRGVSCITKLMLFVRDQTQTYRATDVIYHDMRGVELTLWWM